MKDFVISIINFNRIMINIENGKEDSKRGGVFSYINLKM